MDMSKRKEPASGSCCAMHLDEEEASCAKCTRDPRLNQSVVNPVEFAAENHNSGIQMGINNGAVYLPNPERPETPPAPQSIIPFHRDPDFIDRGALLDQIHKKASVRGARVALVGLGGVGKSQLAIEYCHRVHDKSPNTWILWIHASNPTRFEQSCREIANRGKIPGRKDPKANIFKLLHDWLPGSKESWLLVIDNLDEEYLLQWTDLAQQGSSDEEPNAPTQPVWAYFSDLQGPIIITSRTKRVALEVVEDDDIVTIDPMAEENALSLFEKKLGVHVSAAREDLVELTAALDSMPLAIVQAAVYIKKRWPRMSVKQYLGMFQKGDSQKISLLGDGNKAGYLRRDRAAKSSIFLTLRISFDYIQETRPSAADLLSLMSFFDRQGIPDTLLRPCVEEGSQSHDKPEDELDQAIDAFENDVLMLREYSLISIGTNTTMLGMHRMIQIATYDWLVAHMRLDCWRDRFISILHDRFPSGKFENWAQCQILFAHVLRAESEKPSDETSLGKWITLLKRAAKFAARKGNYVDSIRMSEKAFETSKELLGLNSVKTLHALSMLVTAYHLGDPLGEAENIGRQVLEIQKEILGPEHTSAIDRMETLASIFQTQGQLEAAEKLQLEALRAREKSDPEGIGLLTSKNRLIGIYNNLGRFDEAEELGISTLESCLMTMGPDHPRSLTAMNNLASIQARQGQWQEAERQYSQIIDPSKKVMGPTHPITLKFLYNLAAAYSAQGKWKEAHDIDLEVFNARKEILGQTHPDTLGAMVKLADGHMSYGQHDAAIDLMAQCVLLREQSLGMDHPYTSKSRSLLRIFISFRDQKPQELPVAAETPNASRKDHGLQALSERVAAQGRTLPQEEDPSRKRRFSSRLLHKKK